MDKKGLTTTLSILMCIVHMMLGILKPNERSLILKLIHDNYNDAILLMRDKKCIDDEVINILKFSQNWDICLTGPGDEIRSYKGIVEKIEKQQQEMKYVLSNNV